MEGPEDGAPAVRALAVFHGQGAGVWSRALGSGGFRHCFAALALNGCWVVVDGADAGLPIDVLAGAEFDLAGFYRRQGFTVVETGARPPPSRPLWPFMAATCVGVTKLTLGIRAPFVLTPWRLYRLLGGGSRSGDATKRPSPKPCHEEQGEE
ncbi:MAG: hypothetical protein IIC04_03325 [Proteobacteria bacterium]|nr:hypothetical protein [Pseudomonadota bacterium]